jgi:hypothetical protein
MELVGPAGIVAYDGGDTCRVGTDPRSDLRLPAGTGAPRHALLIPRSSFIEVRTTGADVSIEIDGGLVIDSAVLRPGSTIRFGLGPTFRCEVLAGASHRTAAQKAG